ncbi:hypothetical protein HYW19_04110 [Candidatus Woesearchaeota archaeon]|nr:hypothetical protein [Candidatus Woesearchaeota archaeon]
MADEQLAFLKEYPKGIYRVQFLTTLENEKLSERDETRFRRDLEYLTQHQGERLIQTPDEFFQRWLNGRSDRKPDLSQYVGCKGFELQMPQVRIQRFEEGRTFGRIEGLVIASDFGYSGDFGESIVFAINHIPSQRVLTYHDEDGQKIKRDPSGRKQLTHEPIYQFGGPPEEFPFASLNPLKSAGYTWTLINVTPKEVYDALKKIGFVW